MDRALGKTTDVGQDNFIRLENLSKSYQEGTHTRVVLRDVNATFAKGEFVAILGKSGTGKSTLLNLISGIDRADSGAIWLDVATASASCSSSST